MRYESLFIGNEKSKWLELEVTLGTNESLINLDLLKLQRFLKTLNEPEKAILDNIIGMNLNLENQLALDDNPKVLKLLLIKKFVDQHNLSILREAMSSPGITEKAIYLDITDQLFNHNKYPEKLYIYAAYRQRGTPNTWLKVINSMTPEEVEAELSSKMKGLQAYINYHLNVSRHFRFKEHIGNLTIFVLSKAIQAKVIKGEIRNLEAQRATYTMLVFDKADNKIGVISGSKREVLYIQRYIRYKLLPESIGTPRSEFEIDKKVFLEKILASNEETAVSLTGVYFKTTQLPDQPSLKLKANIDSSLDATLNTMSNVWDNLGIEALKNVDYQFQGKNINFYIYGDDWKRIFINTSAKRKSSLLEQHVLNDLNTRLGANLKETSFVTGDLTDSYIIEKLFRDRKADTFPPVPKAVEKLIVKLINEKLIKKPTKIAKRKCLNCYSFSWNDWKCPQCDRESMIVVGESIHIDPIESNIIRRTSNFLQTDFPNLQITLIPYKQRRNYKKSVIRIYNPEKNLSVFTLLVSEKKDLPFVEDLIHEGFGVIAIIDPEMSEKKDHLEGLGCDLVNLHDVVNKIINGGDAPPYSIHIENQERRVIERIFSNLRISIDQLKNKPAIYNEDLFEIDITNMLQAIVPDVIRLGTEYKGRSVPDGYCCYGYRSSASRRKKRLFGWDAKYSINANYRLTINDLVKQQRYIQWLTSSTNEPKKMGTLGIYAFVSNFDTPNGFNTTLTNLASWNGFPNQCRLVLIQDQLLVTICEWILAHWQQVIDNNSLISDTLFKWFRRKTSKSYNILSNNDWVKLESKLNAVIAQQ